MHLYYISLILLAITVNSIFLSVYLLIKKYKLKLRADYKFRTTLERSEVSSLSR